MYSDKQCPHCNIMFTPTSGHQTVCLNDACRYWYRAQSRKASWDAKHLRPTEKVCADCGEVFPISWTGRIPIHCDKCQRIKNRPKWRAATQEWSQRTTKETCQLPSCDNLQHPSGFGWCFKHYYVWDVHGVSADYWWEMFNSQHGLCPVCQENLLDGRMIHIDHDHVKAEGRTRLAVEDVRGLVHGAPCNSVILGGIETAIANGWMQNVMAYISQ